MAAAVVGGAFLSAFLQVLFDRIASREVVDYLQGKKFNHRLLLKLKIMLLSVNGVLDDAEEKQIRNLAVKEWLDELENAAYDTEDLLDEIATEALQFKLKAGSRTSAGMASDFNPTYLNFYDLDIETKMEENLERLEFLVKQKDVLGLKEGVGEKPSPRIPTTSLVDETEVYGRDDDKEAIIKLLLRDDDDVGRNQVCVIPIVGMGGIGKTTLAQLAYNNDKIKDQFDFKVWVCVSEEFDIFKVTKTVLSAVTSHCCDNMDLDLLQVRLKELLVGKKFLIVLDDVWNENYVSWEVMSKPFKHGARGSRIIVTTRSEKVASIMRTTPNHYLKCLLDEDCQQLFANHAFEKGDFSSHPTLETIGREIVKKCKGLPLAVKTLGGLLRSKMDVGEWERILNSDIWDLSADESDIHPSLWLSYHYLPSHLKRCFAFCSILPKGYEFEKCELVLLWMAENLLQQTKSNKRIEEVGDEYFNDLVSRSFFVRSSADVSRFIMHDLMTDLARFVSKEYCFTLEEGNSKDIVMKVRHLAYVTGYVKNDLKRLDSVFEATRLRTLLPLEMSMFTSTYLSNEVVDNVILKLRHLRALSLSKIQGFNKLPESIGELRHLRYLDLSETMIYRLPESVSMLHNLQTLNLSDCYYLTELPKDMHHLINLRHLDISYCYKLVEMPRQVSKLKNLQTLSTFFAGKENGTKIQELRELSNLRKKLCLENLQNVINVEDALEAKLLNKKYLEELQFSWKGEPDDSRHDMDVLDKLMPHMNLEMLYIKGYGGTRFPNWLGNRSFYNIVFIELSGCKYCNCLPSLGQLPSLKTLNIYNLYGVVTVGAEFYGDSSAAIKPFPSLEALRFRRMSNWEEWFPVQVEYDGAFLNLQELEIGDCDRLITIGLPYYLPSLVKLIIDGCQVLASSLPKTPAIRQLELGNCENLELKELPQTVESIRIGGSNGVKSLIDALRNNQILCLQSLHIHNCPSSITFPAESLSISLTVLDIHNCEKLEFPMHHSLKTSIQKIHISNSCGSLVFFSLDFFSNLKNLDIKRCKNLESLVVSDLYAKT
uniref:putative disease resistance RPP13-like protein 1 n=1 Tax=Ziziphus jujuba TaxID=326968 RepID=A0A6P6G6D0_ZIZJJ